MNDEFVDIGNEEKKLTKIIKNSTGSERAWAYRNLVLLKSDFYTSDELIDLSLEHGFSITDPMSCIKRGTKIESGSQILQGTIISGKNITIRKNAILDNSKISGDNINIGRSTYINGTIELNNVNIAKENKIKNIKGVNNGTLNIGESNIFCDVLIENFSNNPITIGQHNTFYDGITLRIPFRKGQIWIGNYNHLGRDGGGVISCSYRFGKKWWGHIVVGCGVQTTRGAEILGFSLMGWNRETIELITGKSEQEISGLFKTGSLNDLMPIFDNINRRDPNDFIKNDFNEETVSIFGVAKTKRCCLIGRTRMKDNCRTQATYLKNVDIQEGCVFFQTKLYSDDGSHFDIPFQNLSFNNVDISKECKWEKYLKKIPSDKYPLSDYKFF